VRGNTALPLVVSKCSRQRTLSEPVGVLMVELAADDLSGSSVELARLGHHRDDNELDWPRFGAAAAVAAAPGRPWQPEQPQGFTLLEMLVVLAIIGLLVALVGPRLLARLDASKVTTTQTQIHMLRTALDTMRLDIGRYPTTEEGLRLLVSEPTDPDLRAKWRGPYLEGSLPDDAWGHPYDYAFTGNGYPPFSLCSYGPDGKPSAGAGGGGGGGGES
jgi:general secretion pathway protein G